MTVIVNVLFVPTQPLTVGVIVTVEICCVATFAAVNAAILPVPLAAKPVAVLLFVQENIPPEGVLTKLVAETVVPEHATLFVTAFTEGVGFTVITISCNGRQLGPKSGFKIA